MPFIERRGQVTKFYWLADMDGNPVKAPIPPGEYQAYPNPLMMFKDASETATIAVRTFGELVARLHRQLPRVTTRQRRAQTRRHGAAVRKAKRPRITRISVPNKGNR